MINKKRIIIFGGAGSVGSELTRQLYKNNFIYTVDFNEVGLLDLMNELNIKGRVGDIRDENTIRDIFSDIKPQIVFHTAAYKCVNMMEYVPLEAIKTNVLGTWNIINEAKKWKCLEKLVFISSDKAVQSNSIMGSTKKLGEVMVKNQGKGFIVVRFANVLGSRGSLIPIWQRQIDNNKPITITDERMERYFMTIENACDLIIQATEIGQGGEIFILDMQKQINVLELAKKIISETGQDIPIKTIGIRAGETLNEKLMSEEEVKIAVKQGKFFIIR